MRLRSRSQQDMQQALGMPPPGAPESVQQSPKPPRTGVRAIVQYQWRAVILLLIAWIALVIYIGLPLQESHENVEPLTKNESSPVIPRNFHLLVPASKADPNLCKVILSAAITGFPAPALINWGKSFDNPDLVEGGSHLAKISGIHEYLSNLASAEDDSLVLIVDGFDVWMQLRPQTLVDRYLDINRRADERIVGSLGTSANEQNIHQTIIFGCQKRCWPWTENDPPCYAVPQSTLPEDIYGPETDSPTEDDTNPYRNRQRFLNPGVAIGTAKAMRKLFAQALVLLETEGNFGSDQWIFSHIFGDQDVWREIVRRENLGLLERLKEKISGHSLRTTFNPEHIKQVRAKAAARDDGNFEFGIGVDHGSEIGLNTVFGEYETAWLNWNDTDQLRAAE